MRPKKDTQLHSSGGFENKASGTEAASVSGGLQNTAGGTYQSSVSGGYRNHATGVQSSVSGGEDNIAGRNLLGRARRLFEQERGYV